MFEQTERQYVSGYDKTGPLAYLEYFQGDEETKVGTTVTIATLDTIHWFPIHEETV
jgi:hypothetical protein